MKEEISSDIWDFISPGIWAFVSLLFPPAAFLWYRCSIIVTVAGVLLTCFGMVLAILIVVPGGEFVPDGELMGGSREDLSKIVWVLTAYPGFHYALYRMEQDQ